MLTQSMFWRRLSFSDQGLSEPKVSIIEEMEIISKRFEELDVWGKVTLKSKLWEIVYPDLNSMCPPPERVKTKGAQKKSMTKDQQSVIRLTMSMLMHYILCKMVILQTNVVHHHLSKQFQEGPCRCWINFIHAFMIPFKTLLMSKLMVTVDIMQLLPF